MSCFSQFVYIDFSFAAPFTATFALMRLIFDDVTLVLYLYCNDANSEFLKFACPWKGAMYCPPVYTKIMPVVHERGGECTGVE